MTMIIAWILAFVGAIAQGEVRDAMDLVQDALTGSHNYVCSTDTECEELTGISIDDSM
jgi:hypothetical protein